MRHPSEYVRPGPFIDSDHATIIALASELTAGGDSNRHKAVSLYYWVRDEIRYNPYAVSTERRHYRASHVLAQGEGWCVPKAVLLAALCRAAGVPARLGFADVRNHLSTAKMRELMETDRFYFHGYTSIYIDGLWVKATPTFNLSLCDRFDLLPLEFDGLEDSIYHAFDSSGRRHMEYLKDRGEHPDLPFDEMMGVFREHYPRMIAALDGDVTATDWDADVLRETGR